MKTILKRMCRMCSCHKNEEEDNGCSRDHHADEGLGQGITTGLDRIKAQWQTARELCQGNPADVYGTLYVSRTDMR